MLRLKDALPYGSKIYQDVKVTRISASVVSFDTSAVQHEISYIELDDGTTVKKITSNNRLLELITENFAAGTRTDLYFDPENQIIGGYRADGKLMLHSSLTHYSPHPAFLVIGFMSFVAILFAMAAFYEMQGFDFGRLIVGCALLFGGLLGPYLMLNNIFGKKKHHRAFCRKLLNESERQYAEKQREARFMARNP